MSSSDEVRVDSSPSLPIKRKRRKISPGDASSLTCVVCGSAAYGYNFDVISCESCKAFFRRNAQKAANRLSQCVRDGACAVNSNSRKHCPACRMKKCLESGMRKELITPLEKLVNRANYRGKHSQRNSSTSNKTDDEADTKSLNLKLPVSCASSNEDSEIMVPQTSRPSSDDSGTPVQPSAIDIKHSPTSSDSGPGPSSTNTHQHSVIPDQLSSLPPDLLKSLTPEMLAKAKSFLGGGGGGDKRLGDQRMADKRLGDQRMPDKRLGDQRLGDKRLTDEEHDLARECAMMMVGREPHRQMPEPSPPHDPASFMGAMRGISAGDVSSIESQLLKFMNPVDMIKMMQPLPPSPDRPSVLREEVFVELFNSIKSGLMNIARPLKKEEIIKTHLSEMPTNLEGSFNHMENMIRRVIAVLKCLPQFLALTRELQIVLLKRSIHGLFAFCGALAYDPSHNAFRIVYEEESGEISTFFLDFDIYVTEGLKDIRSTPWEGHDPVSYHDKADDLIKVNQIVFNKITRYTENDRFLIITLMCTRFFNQTLEGQDVVANDGMQWILRRTLTELLLFIREYIVRRFSSVDPDQRYQQVVSLFDAIKPLECAGEMLSRVVRVDNLNPLMREFLSLSKVNNQATPHSTSPSAT